MTSPAEWRVKQHCVELICTKKKKEQSLETVSENCSSRSFIIPNGLLLGVVSNVLKCTRSSLNRTSTTSQDNSNFPLECIQSLLYLKCTKRQSKPRSDAYDLIAGRLSCSSEDRQPITSRDNLSAAGDGAEAGPLTKLFFKLFAGLQLKPATTAVTTPATAVTHGTSNKIILILPDYKGSLSET